MALSSTAQREDQASGTRPDLEMTPVRTQNGLARTGEDEGPVQRPAFMQEDAMTKSMSRSGFAGLLALGAASLSAPALASDDILVSYGENGAITRSLAVPTADLRLDTAGGRAQLDGRIMMAARAACGYESVFGIAQPRDFNRCYKEAKADARAKLAPMQTAAR